MFHVIFDRFLFQCMINCRHCGLQIYLWKILQAELMSYAKQTVLSVINPRPESQSQRFHTRKLHAAQRLQILITLRSNVQ